MYFDENNNYFDIALNEHDINIDKYSQKYNSFDTDFNVGNIVFNRHNDSIVDPVEGFNRGSMFQKSYSKYKNHVYKLNVNNKKDELLYKIQIYNFAIRDLNLYLDIHPTETKMLSMYQRFNKELLKLKHEYEREYSPLCVNDVMSDTKWTWINNPWPWDKGGNI